MAEPARTLRDLTERFGLAAFGAAVMTAERADQLAEQLARRGNVTQQEARELIDEAMQRWRGGTARIGERAGTGLTGILRELGLVTRSEYEELELRIAQLEHRLRLVEDRGPA